MKFEEVQAAAVADKAAALVLRFAWSDHAPPGIMDYNTVMRRVYGQIVVGQNRNVASSIMAQAGTGSLRPGEIIGGWQQL